MGKYPGSHELVGQRGAKQIRFIRPDGKRSALFGRSLTYKDPITGAWDLLAPVLSTTKNGWVMTGSFVDLYIRKKGQGHDVVVDLTDPASKKPASFTLSLPALTWQKQMDFGFTQQGLAWRLRVIDGGLALRAPVNARRGSTTYSFGYQSFWKLVPTPAGGLTEGANLNLTRAVMLGSDHMGTDLSNILRHDPSLKPLPNHRASTIYLIKKEQGKPVPSSYSVYPSMKPYPVFH